MSISAWLAIVMSILRWLAIALFSLIGIGLFVFAVAILNVQDSQPTRTLIADEAQRIASATEFINSSLRDYGHRPNLEEFQAWAKNTPEALRFDGVGFLYVPLNSATGSAYQFEWYRGNGVWLIWRPDATDQHSAEIDPSHYFMFGSKLLDLVVFMGLGLLAFFFSVCLAFLGKRKH